MADKAGRARTLSESYLHFGQTDVKDASPLYEAVATAIGQSAAALAAIERAPVLKRHPTVILAAIHDQVLRGHTPGLARAYAQRDTAAAGPAAIAALVDRADAVIATATVRQTQTNETGRMAILYPAIALAAQRVGASRVGLIDVGCSAGLNLSLDRACITYSNGLVVGDVGSALQLTCDVRGEQPVPTGPMPDVVARVGIDLDPIDLDDEADARWLRACLWPDQPERLERLDAAMALSSTDPPTVLAGDALERLPDALARVPVDALAVITTTWALAYFSLENRLRFLRRLDEAAAIRPIVWISAEGVGIAPAVPTLGDSRLAAHSLVGVMSADGARVSVETVARCHPHGRWVEWLA